MAAGRGDNHSYRGGSGSAGRTTQRQGQYTGTGRGTSGSRSSGSYRPSGNGYARTGSGAGGSGRQSSSGSRRAAQARKKRKLVVFGIEIAIIAVMLVALVFVLRLTDSDSAPLRATVDDITPEKIGVSEEIQQKLEDKDDPMNKYLNIALFGVDATSTSQKALIKGFRSDSTIIASINLETYDVKLLSVYRDTYLNLGNDSYNKCNGAYSAGGATQALTMLNSNLDLYITNFVTVSYKGLSGAIDALGGITIDVQPEEIQYINGYQASVAEVMKCEYTPVQSSGPQTLNGIQAAAYCRIRATAGDDFKRTQRQRDVLKQMLIKAKSADASSLTRAFNALSSDVYTSLDNDTVIDILKNINRYNIVSDTGFPNEEMRKTGTLGSKGSCVVPNNLEMGVKWIHGYLFDDMEYVPSTTVIEYSNRIRDDASKYISDLN